MEFENTIGDLLRSHNMPTPPIRVHIRIPDAAAVLQRAFYWTCSRMGIQYRPHPAYIQVADWLSDNHGLGLFMYGKCGQGKTLLAKYVLPAILLYYVKPRGLVVNYYDMTEANRKIDEILEKHIIALDDVGTESTSVIYGNKRNAFDEIMDQVEKNGKLVIITSNLTFEELSARYESRVIDRIIATTRRILFNSDKSFRRED